MYLHLKEIFFAMIGNLMIQRIFMRWFYVIAKTRNIRRRI